MTDDELNAMEADARELLRASLVIPADFDPARDCAEHTIALVAEVRRLQSEIAAFFGFPYLTPEATVELQAKLTATPRLVRSNKVVVLPRPEHPLKDEADKQKAIADLQRTPVDELVQIWDVAAGTLSIGVRLKSAADACAAELDMPARSYTPELITYIESLRAAPDAPHVVEAK